MAQQQVNQLLADPRLWKDFNQSLRQACLELEQVVHVLPQEGLSAVSTEDLLLYRHKHEKAHEHCARLGLVSESVERFSSDIINMIRSIVSQRIIDEAECDRCIMLLLVQEELSVQDARQAQRLHLAAVWQAIQGVMSYEMNLQAWLNDMEAHYRDTCYYDLVPHGSIPSFQQMIDEVKRLAQSRPDIAQQLRINEERLKADLRARQTLIDELQLSDSERGIIDAFRESLHVKSLLLRAQQYARYRFQPIRDEMARRFEASDHGPQEPVDRLQGITACRGYATGITYVVASDADMQAMPNGAILVIAQARPEYTAVFAKSAAVVCDQGGVTSHAAIIAREYGVPCVVASKHACRSFPTGTKVVVDANRAEIRRLC